MTNWSKEEDDLLHSLAGEGKSSTEIGACMHRSRSSVMGRAFRHGLKLNGNHKKAVEKAVKDKLKPRRIVMRTQVDGVPPPRAEPRRKKGKLGISLLELEFDSCRWPLGDVGKPGFCFCGAARLESSSYCAEHHRKAHDGRTAGKGMKLPKLSKYA